MFKDAHLKRHRADSFDSIAEEYEKYRPGYPVSMKEFLAQRANLKPGADLLEIGVGAGQATRLFVDSDHKIVGIEPGVSLRNVALKVLGYPPNLIMEEGTFETWDPKGRSFDFIYSGSAFHWVDPEIGFAKVARLMRPDAHFALFWNMFPRPEAEIWHRLTDAYRRMVPEIAIEREKKTPDSLIEMRREQIYQTQLFREVGIHQFKWEKKFNTNEYLNLLSTYSDHITLAPEMRTKLFAELTSIIENNGGFIIRPWNTVLFLMKK